MEALWRFFLFSKDSRVFSAIFDFHNGLETFVKTPWKCNSSPHHFSGGWLGRRWRLHRWGLSPPYCGEDEPNFGEAYFFQVGWWTNNQLVNFLFKCVSFLWSFNGTFKCPFEKMLAGRTGPAANEDFIRASRGPSHLSQKKRKTGWWFQRCNWTSIFLKWVGSTTN